MSVEKRKSKESKTKSSQDPLDTTMSLGDHLEELRSRLLYALAGLALGAILGLFFGRYIIAFVRQPYVSVMGEDANLQTLAPAEGFTSYIKISLVAGLLASSPWVFYHIWMFVAAGLYPKERKYVYIAVPFSTALFICGAVFFLVIVAPLALGFFLKINNWVNLGSDYWTFMNYIAFITHLMLVFGIAFQTPIAIFFLNKTGLVSLKALSASRKYVMLVIVIAAAMATPPDVVSQIALAIPLYLLFELGILLSYFAGRKKKS
jgi:sec-independent protein translocase protein TatC